MAKVTDPVCGMTIDSDQAAGQSEFDGRTYYFCSRACLNRFETDPRKYVEGKQPQLADQAPRDLERHEPPYTKAGGIVAPKFGSAGSGGAEYELLPEQHDDSDRP